MVCITADIVLNLNKIYIDNAKIGKDSSNCGGTGFSKVQLKLLLFFSK